jgi:uncharacterized protein YjiS (DUF1127 family)
MRCYVLNWNISLETAGIFRLRQRLENWLARRAIANLDRFGDYLLRDIGVTREDMRWARDLPLSQDADIALEARCAEKHQLARAMQDDVRPIRALPCSPELAFIES